MILFLISCPSLMLSSSFSHPFSQRKRIALTNSRIQAMEISPSGDFLAVSSEDSTLALLSVNSNNFKNKEYIETPHVAGILGIDYPTEDTLYTAGADGTIGLFDLSRSVCRRAYKVGRCCTKISSSRNYNLFAACTSNEILFFDEFASFKPVYRIAATEPKVAFRPDTGSFAVCTGDHTLQLFDMRSISRPYEKHISYPRNQSTKMSSAQGNTSRAELFIDSITPTRKYILGKEPNSLVDCVFSKNGSFLLVTEHRRGPVIYRADRSRLKAQFIAPEMDNLVTFKSFRFGGPNDSFVLAGFDNKKVNYWAINQNIDGDNIVDVNYSKKSSRRICFTCTRSSELTGFRSVINVAVMHPSKPIIFCGGVENALYAFSPFYLGSDDMINPNEEAIVYTDTWLEEVYGSQYTLQ